MKGKKGGKQQLDSSPPQQGPSNEQQQQTGIASTEDLDAEADGRRSGNATEPQRKRRFRPSFTSRNRPQLQKHGTAASSEETLKLADNAERGNAGHHRRRESSAAPVALFTIPCCLFCLLVSAFVLLLFLVTGYHLGKYLRAANATSGAIPLPGKEEEEQLMVAGLFMAVPRTTTDSDSQQIGAILNGASGSQPKLANELQALAQKESDSQYFDPQFGRDLVKAAKHGKTEVVRRLLDHGLDVNDTRNGYGNTALHLAATYGHLETTKLLLERGAPVEATNSKHQTALYYASCEGKQQVVQLLIQFGADVNSRGRDGNTPLHCAAEEGWDRVVDLLIQNGAKVNAKNARGFMPLHWAAQYGKLEACRVLLANGADLGARVTSNSVTALHLAAQEGHVQMLRLLLDHGANVAERDKYGWTPLHYAIRSGRISCVRLLLEHWSGDVDPRDSASLFALIDRGDDQIRELIMRKVFS